MLAHMPGEYTSGPIPNKVRWTQEDVEAAFPMVDWTYADAGGRGARMPLVIYQGVRYDTPPDSLLRTPSIIRDIHMNAQYEECAHNLGVTPYAPGTDWRTPKLDVAPPYGGEKDAEVLLDALEALHRGHYGAYYAHLGRLEAARRAHLGMRESLRCLWRALEEKLPWKRH
jgi:hypothetical protein